LCHIKTITKPKSPRWINTKFKSPYDKILARYQEKPDLFLGNPSYYCMGLNNQIIKPSIKEIEQKTDLKIKVELQRFGRRISHIIFRFKRDEQKDMFK
jgi:plasmid replication initiation protein